MSGHNPGGRVVHVTDRVAGAVYVGRAMPRLGLPESPFGNGYKIGRDGDRAICIAHYHDDLMHYAGTPSDLLHRLPELRGKPLACWCRHDGEERTTANACHGDVLLEVLDRWTDEELVAMGKRDGAE